MKNSVGGKSLGRMSGMSGRSLAKSTGITCLAKKYSLLAVIIAVAAGPMAASAQDTSLSRFLLIKLSRDQSSVLCGSEKFTQCMAFTEEQCLALSEKAIDQCLKPLPERIDPADLQNAAIESCPREIYADAGYKDEKAQKCLAEAMKP